MDNIRFISVGVIFTLGLLIFFYAFGLAMAPKKEEFGLLGSIANRKGELNQCLRWCGIKNPTDSLGWGDIICEKMCYEHIEAKNNGYPSVFVGLSPSTNGSRGWCEMMCESSDLNKGVCVEKCKRKWDVSDRGWSWDGVHG